MTVEPVPIGLINSIGINRLYLKHLSAF